MSGTAFVVAAIIGGAIKLGTGIGGAIRGRKNEDQYREDLKRAENQARAMEALRRKDEQALISWQKREAELNRKEQEAATVYQKEQDTIARGERAEEKGFQRRRGRFQDTMGMINNNAQMRSQVAGMLRRPTNAV